ncbi:uncharacterized protein METZ01_LOCUS131182 [marine metagenome]|uniref:Uncharacterized protein n=1 Tax=marine metagenome TaxID=408172 RepID=A0A381YMS4_9ZZZZ
MKEVNVVTGSSTCTTVVYKLTAFNRILLQ